MKYMEKFDAQRCAEHLGGMIRFATVSNGDISKMDFDLFAAFHRYLEETYPLVHKTMTREIVGKAGLLYHWKGTGKSDRLPLLLLAHQDVVAEGEHSAWKYPPFAGEIAEGRVWGRGTTDSKCNILAHMEGIEQLIADGFVPDCDIWIAYGYNEETMGHGVPAGRLIAEELVRRGIRFGCVIDECGGVQSGKMFHVKPDICEIVVAEKGYVDYEIRVRDKGGHSMCQYKDSALVKLARAILLIEENPLPFRVVPIVKMMYEKLAPFMEGDLGRLLSDIDGNWEELKKVLETNRYLGAQFRTTLAMTMASGSAQPNVYPEVATLTINCRLLDGDTAESVLAYLRNLLPEEYEVEQMNVPELSKVSPVDSFGFQLISKIASETYLGLLTLPGYMLGGTDSRYYYRVSDNVYRFNFFYDAGNWGPAHRVNENIPVNILPTGPAFVYRYVKEYSSREE